MENTNTFIIPPIDDGEGVKIFKSRDNLGRVEEGCSCREVAGPFHQDDDQDDDGGGDEYHDDYAVDDGFEDDHHHCCCCRK